MSKSNPLHTWEKYRLKDLEEMLDIRCDARDPEEWMPISYPLQGFAATIPGAVSTSPVRLGSMAVKAQETALPLEHYDIPIVTTGIEAVLADHCEIIKMPSSGTVVQILEVNKNHYKVMYEEINGTLRSVDVRNFVKGHEKFGFPLYFTEDFLKLTKGDYIEEGVILADSHQRDLGMISWTRAMIGVPGTFNQSSEDSILFCEESLEELGYYTYTDLTLSVDRTDILLNANGTKEKYKPIPEIGDHIREDGAVMGKRNVTHFLSPAILTDDALMEFNEAFDKVLYNGSGGGLKSEVVAIEIINTERKDKFPEMMDQINELLRKRDSVASNLKAMSRKYTKIHPSIIKDVLYNHAIANVKKITYKAKPVNVRIKLTIKKLQYPTLGSKGSGRHGNKGIICGVEKRANMPRFENGVTADFIFEAATVGNRQNTPVITLGGLGTLCRQLQHRIRIKLGLDPLDRHIERHHYIDRIDEENFKWIRDKILGFLETMESPLFPKYVSLSDIDFMDVLEEVVEDEFRVLLPEPNKIAEIIAQEKLNTSEFRLQRMKMSANLDNKYVDFEDECSYIVQDFLIQNKLPDKPKVVTIPFENHFELSTSLKADGKHYRQYNCSAMRFLGAVDMRIIMGYVPNHVSMELIESGKSPQVRNYAYGSILRADKPSNIDKAVDRNLIPFGQDPFTKIYQSITQSVGYIPFNEDGGWKERYKFEPSFRNVQWKFAEENTFNKH